MIPSLSSPQHYPSGSSGGKRKKTKTKKKSTTAKSTKTKKEPKTAGGGDGGEAEANARDAQFDRPSSPAGISKLEAFRAPSAALASSRRQYVP